MVRWRQNFSCVAPVELRRYPQGYRIEIKQMNNVTSLLVREIERKT